MALLSIFPNPNHPGIPLKQECHSILNLMGQTNLQSIPASIHVLDALALESLPETLHSPTLHHSLPVQVRLPVKQTG